MTDLPFAARFPDAARPGRLAPISTARTCQIVALVWAVPATTDRPISPWTGRELAAEILKHGILDHISPPFAWAYQGKVLVA